MQKDFNRLRNKHTKAKAANAAVAKRGMERRATKQKTAASSTSINLNDEIQNEQGQLGDAGTVCFVGRVLTGLLVSCRR